MATKNPQQVQDLKIIMEALAGLQAGYERKAAGAGTKGDMELKGVYDQRAAAVKATTNRIATGELFQ